jgi:hypothetical protein
LGVRLGELTEIQREKVRLLLAECLSHRGYVQSTEIMALDDIFRELSLAALRRGENVGLTPEEAADFNSNNYWILLFRDPVRAEVWGWRLEGHHLSLNFTVVDGLLQGTPTFMGTQPARVPSGPRGGLRILADEIDLGRDLIRSLNAAQNELARLKTDLPNDIITGPRGKGRLDSFEGIPAVRLNAQQQQKLRRLIRCYVDTARADVAQRELEALEKAGFEKIYFAWAGDAHPKKPFYYRVHGPTIVIEFDNTASDPDHIHSVWHGQDDFGVDLLRQHYEQHPHPHR